MTPSAEVAACLARRKRPRDDYCSGLTPLSARASEAKSAGPPAHAYVRARPARHSTTAANQVVTGARPRRDAEPTCSHSRASTDVREVERLAALKESSPDGPPYHASSQTSLGVSSRS